MKFFEQIAQLIVEKTSTVLGAPMSISDDDGIIIGCSDVTRIGSYHEVTKDVFKAGKAVQYSVDKVAGRKNVLPGVATPIYFQQEPIGVLGIIGDPDEVIKYVYLVRNHVEMLLYETFKVESFSIKLKTTENFIQYLLHFRQDENRKEIINYCEMIGFNVDNPRVCILINIPNQTMESIKILQYDLFQLITKLFKEQSDDIVTTINIKQWIVLKCVKEHDQDKLIENSKQALEKINNFLQQHHIQSKAFIALGNCYTGIEGMRRSFQQALKLLSIGNQFSMKEIVYSYKDWNVLINSLVGEINPTFLESMVEHVANLMEHSSATVLIDTFLTYCEQGLNMSKAARELYIHRNTLLYRLNQINEILQINVNSFEQSMFLYLALKGKSLNKDRGVRGECNLI